MAATPTQLQQIQGWAGEVRKAAELYAKLQAQATYMRSNAFDDIYALLVAQGGAGWTDSRTDGPPHLMTESNILAANTWLADFLTFTAGNAQTPVMKSLIVNGPNG